MIADRNSNAVFPSAQSALVTSPSANVRRIPRTDEVSSKTAEREEDIFIRLAHSPLGKFYKRHSGRHSWMPALAKLFWPYLFALLNWRYTSNLFGYFRSSPDLNVGRDWLPLIKQSEFSDQKALTIFKLANATVVKTPRPAAYPISKANFVPSGHDQYLFPRIYVIDVHDALIHGGSNLVVTESSVLCHDLFDPTRDFTPEEMHKRVSIDHEKGTISFLKKDPNARTVPSAATFVDGCAANYAHWLTEVLPRIALFCSNPQFSDVSIVINDGLHDNIMESVALVAGSEREVICLPIGRTLHADQLYLTSCAGYVPFEPRGPQRPDHSHGLFSPDGISAIRNKVAHIALQRNSSYLPKKIYVQRESRYRKLQNNNEITRVLTAAGFVTVMPELLTFSEQVRLFSNAEIIIGPTGAAMANVIFCSPTTKVFILISANKGLLYDYWQNIACSAGLSVSYIFGSTNDGSVHADFTIDVSDLSHALGNA